MYIYYTGEIYYNITITSSLTFLFCFFVNDSLFPTAGVVVVVLSENANQASLESDDDGGAPPEENGSSLFVPVPDAAAKGSLAPVVDDAKGSLLDTEEEANGS